MSAATVAAMLGEPVDLIGLIRDGLPEREFVPGSDGLIPRAKRATISAAAKSGKSLTVGIVMPLDIVVAGGTVAVLDRENGADEYARRLASVLDARQADDALRELVKERLRYYAWPNLSLSWRDDPSYPAALAGVDVAVFDSTRSHTAPLGLDEDKSDDWAAFTTALIDPLAQAGSSTVLLDNMGHEEKGRPRGTSAKGDLCDLAYTMKVVRPFSLTVAGQIELRCAASRLGEITIGDAWRMELGGGVYGAWQAVERTEHDGRAVAFRPTAIMEKVSRAVEQTGGLSKTAIRAAVGGKKDYADLALELLIAERYIERRQEGQAHRHYSARAYRQDDEDTPDEDTVATVAQPWPNRGPARVERTVAPWPPPIGGPGPGHESGQHENGNRGPRADGGLTEDEYVAEFRRRREQGLV